MDCKWHPGHEADLTCMQCSRRFCRDCVKESKATHYCPDCHQAELDRFATALDRAAQPPKPKKENAPGEKKKDDRKHLKKPKEFPSGPPPPIPAVAPPPPEPVATITPEEKADFWGDMSEPRHSRKRGRAQPVPPPPSFEPVPVEEPAGARPLEPVAPPAPVAPPDLEPVRSEAGAPAPGAPPAQVDGRQRPVTADVMVPLARQKDRRRIPGPEERERAILMAEGFPAGPREREGDTEDIFKGRMARRKKRRSGSGDGLVAMQVPDDYDGELTVHPSYIKAVLWGLLAGFIGAGVYAAVAWWRHGEQGILGWLIGLVVGLTVVFASGRHFNWKLGLIALGIAVLFLSAGRVFIYMLTIWFPSLPIDLPFSNMHNLSESFTQFLKQFPTLKWLMVFCITGGVAFLVSFRPWPIKIQTSSQAPPERVARRRA